MSTNVVVKTIAESLKGSKLPKLAKLFASSEAKLRNKAFKIVVKLLSTAKGVGTTEKHISWSELIAICKGLHYWLWMQDKMILHEEVVGKLCTIIGLIPEIEVRQQFVKCIFETENREWDTLDVHRVDKFMMLVRDFFAACLEDLKAHNWSSLDNFITVIEAYLVNTNIEKSVGLKMHFADLILAELTKAEVDANILDRFVEPFYKCLEFLPTDGVYSKRIRQDVFDGLLNRFSTDPSSVNVHLIGRKLFTIGKSKNIRAGNRKVLYAMARRFGLPDDVLDEKFNDITDEANDNGDQIAPDAIPMELDQLSEPVKNKIASPVLSPTIKHQTSPKTKQDSSQIAETPPSPSNSKKRKRNSKSPTQSSPAVKQSVLTPTVNLNSPSLTKSPNGKTPSPFSTKKKNRNSNLPLNTTGSQLVKQAVVSPTTTMNSVSVNNSLKKTPSPSDSKKRKRDSRSPSNSSPAAKQVILVPATLMNSTPLAKSPVLKSPSLMSDSMLSGVLDDSELSLKKRVSFGKIYRKPFRKKDTVLTPSPSTLKVTKTPDKGILKPKRLSFVSSSAQKMTDRILRKGKKKGSVFLSVSR